MACIEHYRSQIEREMELYIEQMGEQNLLRDACEYALTNGGKRLRPILVLMIADALGHGLDVLPVALGVEFFHTASLIADDLPCMDDDDMRRSRPSLHKRFGESIAILASYTLIAEGYGSIYLNCQRMKERLKFGAGADKASLLCLESATRCAGIRGATNGQFLDLYPPDSKPETIRKIIFQKTSTLFEISFVFGWLFGGGSVESLADVQKSAHHLGLAFQIADDLQDASQDASKPIQVNIVAAYGRETSEVLLEEEIELFKGSLKRLGLWNESFQQVVEWLLRLPNSV
ncbi:MAG: polyprenyl synthetase family protein [Chlamydiota bacterium]